MTYHFDLTADDYREMNLAAYKWLPVLLHFLPHALSASLAVYLIAPWALQASSQGASIAALVAFGSVLAWMFLSWHRKVLGAIDTHYGTPARSVIFGPHTLSLTDSGLESSGPMHRSFRDWRCVTEVRVTKTQVLFYTAFGVIYILPLRAVQDLPALEKWLSDRHVEQPNRSLERGRAR